MHAVRLYSRPGCHLCEDAKAVILQVRDRFGFAFEEVDIDGNDDLVREYGVRIPVVDVDGEETFEITVDAERLAALVRM